MRFARFLYSKKFSDGELVGSIAYFAGQSSAPDGWVLCDGSAVSRTTYATLFTAISTTYGAGDGSTTFALPNLIDKFVEGSTIAGTVKSAGLPNITGSFGIVKRTGPSDMIYDKRGAFSANATTSDSSNMVQQSSAGSAQSQAIGFDASKASSIYGNSTTVQPPALTMKPFIYTGKTSVNKWLRTV